MQRIPFCAGGWTLERDPGLPAPDDKEDEVIFGEPPASPDPSSPATSCYEIAASNVVSESSSIPTSGLPTLPPKTQRRISHSQRSPRSAPAHARYAARGGR